MFFIICWVITVLAALATSVFKCLQYRDTKNTETLIDASLNIAFYWAIVAATVPDEVLYAITR